MKIDPAPFPKCNFSLIWIKISSKLRNVIKIFLGSDLICRAPTVWPRNKFTWPLLYYYMRANSASYERRGRRDHTFIEAQMVFISQRFIARAVVALPSPGFLVSYASSLPRLVCGTLCVSSLKLYHVLTSPKTTKTSLFIEKFAQEKVKYLKLTSMVGALVSSGGSRYFLFKVILSWHLC